MDNNYVPKDYEDLYQAYFTKGKLGQMLCKKLLFGRVGQDWEDAAQEAYLRMLKINILERFDAAKSNFGGMVFMACQRACINMGRHGQKDNRNITLEATGEETGTIKEDRLQLDEGEEGRILASLEVEKVRARARERAQHSKAKRFQNQEKLIDLMLEGYTKEEIAGTLQVSRASVDLWITALSAE